MHKWARMLVKTGKAYVKLLNDDRNERGLRLVEFATFRGLVLADTFGHHKASRPCRQREILDSSIVVFHLTQACTLASMDPTVLYLLPSMPPRRGTDTNCCDLQYLRLS